MEGFSQTAIKNKIVSGKCTLSHHSGKKVLRTHGTIFKIATFNQDSNKNGTYNRYSKNEHATFS